VQAAQRCDACPPVEGQEDNQQHQQDAAHRLIVSAPRPPLPAEGRAARGHRRPEADRLPAWSWPPFSRARSAARRPRCEARIAWPAPA
jgi:hypothetical protein